MRPHGRARVSSRNPNAFGICDRCGFLYNHNQLQWQFDWAGASLINKRILVCDTCNDVPQQQLRAIVVPADPVPILNPRVQDYYAASTDVRTTQGNTINALTGLPVIGGDERVTQSVAIPNNLTTDYILLEDLVGYLMGEDQAFILLQEGDTLDPAIYTRVTQQTGEAPGGLNQTPGTDPNAPGNDTPGLPEGNVVIPETGPL